MENVSQEWAGPLIMHSGFLKPPTKYYKAWLKKAVGTIFPDLLKILQVLPVDLINDCNVV